MKTIDDDFEAIPSCDSENDRISLNETEVMSKIETQEDASTPNESLKLQRRMSTMVKCEHCHNQFSQKDYIDHKV
jgi:hypothetical protein